MNRYLFWILMLHPWFWLTIYYTKSENADYFLYFFVALILYLCLVLNIRRKYVGLSLSDTLKAIVPGLAYKEWHRLYFAKP